MLKIKLSCPFFLPQDRLLPGHHHLPQKKSSWRVAARRPGPYLFRLPGLIAQQMHLDTRPQLTDSSSDIEEFRSDRVEMRPCPRPPFKVISQQGMQQHLGRGMKQEPELVGLEAMTGGPVGEKMALMELDHQFHPSAVAVNHLVNTRLDRHSSMSPRTGSSLAPSPYYFPFFHS